MSIMNKSKKDTSRAPGMLLWEISFEFVSPLSLDECSSCIEAINANNPFLSETRKLFLSSVEQHKILFHLSEPAIKSVDGWAVGYLEELPDGNTCVSGKVGVAPEIIILLGMFGIMGLVLLPTALSSIRAFLFVVTVVGLILLVIVLVIRHTRSKLIDQLLNLLGDIDDSI
jgi:hypothetical protein